MSRGIMLDIMALYAHDPNLFNNMTIPTTITWTENTVNGTVTHTETIPYSKQTVIDNLCMECAELEVLYPDSDYMKLAIGVWSDKRLYTWQRIADVLYRKYDPFINIQRNEWRTTQETRDLAKSETRDLARSETRNLAGSETRNLAGTNDSTVTGNVNAFNDNSADGVQRDKVTTDQDTTDTGTVNTTNTGTLGTTDTGTVDYTDNGTVTTTDQYHVEGDSAIRDAQDIIRLETEQRLAHDLIDIIIEEFKKRFCLGVY